MTLRYAKEHINRQALRDLSCLGIRSWNTNTCGLHVHIGRDTFVNYSHLARFLILLHRSKPSIVALAGRDCSRWASFDLGQDESIVLQAQGKQYPQTRYRAVNLTNDDTVEVRVFRGTLNPDTIIAHLELLDAMIEYTRRQRKIVGLSMSLTWLWFRGWLADNNETYPAANERCAARVDNRRI
jgi:gamma-glutamyl:cysteine ligase YbdK (ATP-grasp superfamily)